MEYELIIISFNGPSSSGVNLLNIGAINVVKIGCNAKEKTDNEIHAYSHPKVYFSKNINIPKISGAPINIIKK